MSKLSKHHLWDWFRRHSQEYLELHNKTKKEEVYWLSELNAHLRAYYKFFGFSLMVVHGKKANLTITVNGNNIHFKKVDDLVAKAPKIPDWTISALDDPRPIDFLLEPQIKQTGIHPQELYFSFAGDDPHDAALIVYHPLCTEQNGFLIYKLAISALYNLLGERSFGTDIDRLEVANLSTADRDGVKVLEELPACIGLRKSAMVVDSRGGLVKMDRLRRT